MISARSRRDLGAISAWRYHRSCKAYRGVNYTDELGDMALATRKLSQEAYFLETMGHRFCLNAPGDFVSTPKITEFVAVGAADGCLPVIVLRGPPAGTLPYTRWLDWCEIAVLVRKDYYGYYGG